MECNCYVKTLSPEDQFSLRRGAHTRCCPVYRESLDPVDRIHDSEAREYHLGQLWPQYQKGKQIEVYQYSPSTYWVSYLENGQRHDTTMDLSLSDAVIDAGIRRNVTGYPIVRNTSPTVYQEAMADPEADPYWPFNGDREAFYSDRADRMA